MKRHESDEEAPSGQKLPARHASQAVLPMPLWNLPAGQAVQAGWPVLDENAPALQLIGAALPVVQKLPVGHAMHCVRFAISVRFEYRPAGQGSTDEVPFGQKDPAVHGSQAVSPMPL